MYIIFGQEAAEKLQEQYTLLPLETLERNGKLIQAFCVVPADKITISDLVTLNQDKESHYKFIQEFNNKNYNYCLSAANELIGKFGGELDSFYEEILKRIEKSTA